ncbi:hypothetical protein BKA64DRAFT_356511 [Cadophora sp. MPI-SDFR-AT-0126]|nr:hypothetical protein BKA64DRAFT_356511 [Leotiomycetes sp. MPI-SDFR-AT-0126]
MKLLTSLSFISRVSISLSNFSLSVSSSFNSDSSRQCPCIAPKKTEESPRTWTPIQPHFHLVRRLSRGLQATLHKIFHFASIQNSIMAK